MVETNVRGSSHLDTLTPEDLNKSIGAARDTYKVERWWKYGQPKIDLIEATYNVTDVGQVGAVVGGLVSQHGAKLQVNFDVFPYGITVPDGVLIHVKMNPLVG
jgi:hypothetical protein